MFSFQECIPRIRTISSSTSSSTSSSSDLSSTFERSDSNGGPSKPTEFPNGAGEGKVRGWQKEPLSIMWCLNSFDTTNTSSQSRVILYDKKSVMAVESPPKGSVDPSGDPPKKKKKKKKIRKGPRHRKRSQRTNQDDPAACLSCDSIDSSPTHYKDDVQWTGYKTKWKKVTTNEETQRKSVVWASVGILLEIWQVQVCQTVVE